MVCKKPNTSTFFLFLAETNKIKQNTKQNELAVKKSQILKAYTPFLTHLLSSL